MFYVTLNDLRLLVGTKADHDRLSVDCLALGNGLYTATMFTRGEMYQAMEYKTIDFAYPEPWADDMRRANQGLWHNKTPKLVWCYDNNNFGEPVYDDHVIRAMGDRIQNMLIDGNVEFVSWEKAK